MATDGGKTLALDVGSVRIGLALASNIARIPSPMGALQNDSNVLDELQALCKREDVRCLVVGLPRGLSGQETGQTAFARDFGETLTKALGLPVIWQDEAVTSVQAEAELKGRGKPYAKGDIDALAATYILEDYFRENV